MCLISPDLVHATVLMSCSGTGPPHIAAGPARLREEHSAQGSGREAGGQVAPHHRQDLLQRRELLILCPSADCCLCQPGESAQNPAQGIFRLQTLLMPVIAAAKGAAKGAATALQSVLRGSSNMQVDNHIAELTVRETLDFAARVLGVGHKEGGQPRKAWCSLPPCVVRCPHGPCILSLHCRKIYNATAMPMCAREF